LPPEICLTGPIALRGRAGWQNRPSYRRPFSIAQYRAPSKFLIT
jgi:hypothetical protein